MITIATATAPARSATIIECALIDGLLRLSIEGKTIPVSLLANAIAKAWPDHDGEEVDECPSDE